MRKEKLIDLARRVEEKVEDIHVIRRQGNRILIWMEGGVGGTVRLVSREWLENYELEIDH